MSANQVSRVRLRHAATGDRARLLSGNTLSSEDISAQRNAAMYIGRGLSDRSLKCLDRHLHHLLMCREKTIGLDAPHF